ncbi:MAG: YitT family protein [Lachnospiraceae bacterium]|nr:YitT family protein [Lachnospiraceae bacterium]MBQ4069170.1 YitT family protein [Lachnospiraceae bacterium]
MKLILITFAALIYSIGIGIFLEPNNLAPGGVTGISIMLNHLFKIPTGIGILFINIPILLVGFKKLGRKLMGYTLYALVISSVVVDLLVNRGICVTRVPILAALFGGGLVGFGLGIIFRNGGTTGGLDIIVRLVKMKYRYIKTGAIFLISDIIVVSISAFVFKDIDVALYAGISVMSASLVMNKVLYGGDEAKCIYIFSEKNHEIAQILLDKLSVGVSYIKSKGAYTGRDTEMIMCVMRRQQLPEAAEIVENIDDGAFLIVTSATEIFGEGYKKHGTYY